MRELVRFEYFTTDTRTLEGVCHDPIKIAIERVDTLDSCETELSVTVYTTDPHAPLIHIEPVEGESESALYQRTCSLLESYLHTHLSDSQ